jgi:hypothetical protein
MGANIPQDVDLEDRLIYGLTPVRFGYLVVAVLVAMVLWRLGSLPPLLRLAGASPVLVAAVILAWGRWRRRPADLLLLDLFFFFRRNYRVVLSPVPRHERRARPLEARMLAIDLSAVNRIDCASAVQLERAA